MIAQRRGGSSSTPKEVRGSSARLAAFGWLGTVASVVLLWWTLRDVSFSSLGERLADTRLGWLTAAMGLAIAMYPLRAARWRSAIAGTADLPYAEAYHALAIGNMANNLLPARVGEIVAPWVISRRTATPLGTAGASVVLLRLLDAAAVLVLAAVGLALGPAELTSRIGAFPLWVVAIIAGGLLSAVLAVLAALTARPDRLLQRIRRWITPHLPDKLSDAIEHLTESALEGLGALRGRGSFLVVSAQSLAVWLAAAAAFGCGFRAFGLELHWTAGLVVLAVNTFAVLLPSTPGFFGVFEAATRVALSIFGVAGTEAGEIGLPLHLLVFFATAVGLGLVSMARTSIGFAELRAAR